MAYDLKSFTVEEKIKLLAGQDTWHTEDFSGRLYKVKVSDGPVGLRTPAYNPKTDKWEDLPAVAYPSTQVLSQTWDKEIAYKTGEFLADDCIEKGVDVLLAPGVNIKRNVLCGRNFEYFSEDPYLAGVMAREYVKGVQVHNVGTTVKHYCANNQERCRFWVSSEVDERTLREIYLEPFRIAEEAQPWAIMCAYNLVNGVRMSEHKKLYSVLRDEFKHGDRLIMSDWSAVQDRVASLKAGLDLEMPYSLKGYNRLMEAYKRGEITEEEIDACAKRVLDFIEKCEKTSQKREIQSTQEERLQGALKVAEEGIVLLKNDGVLPIKSGESVAVIGHCAEYYTSGGGSSRVVPLTNPKPLHEALKDTLKGSEVTFKSLYGNHENFYVAVNEAYGKDVAIVCVNNDAGEGWDRESMKLNKNQEMIIAETAKLNENVVVIVYGGAPIDMSDWIDCVSAVLWVGYPGEMGSQAIANIVSGKVNPSGKTTESFPYTLADSIAEYSHADFMKSGYEEGLFVGYRLYDGENTAGLQTLFPFGYGLSYSEFDYGNLKCEKVQDGVKVSFDITNISDVEGAEVAQIYVREVHPKVIRPYKELKQFARVKLKGGETKRVELLLNMHAFEYYSTALDCWTHTPGRFEILVGASVEDILLQQTVEIE